MQSSRPSLWVLVLLAACGSGSATPEPVPNPGPHAAPRDSGVVDADVAKLPVKTVYLTLCSPCHGAEAKGYAADHAPSLVTSTFLESATDAFLQEAIITGRPGTSMGAYGARMGGPLDDAAVARLVAYLRALGPAAQTLPVVEPGNADRGAPLYASTCKVCHGDPMARGEAIQLTNARLLQQASDAYLHYAISRGRPGTKMEAFAGKLTPGQISDVVAFIRQLGGQTPQVKLLPPPTGKEPLEINPKGKAPTWTPREDRFISIDDVHKALDAKRKMIIIDARPPSEWMRVHITGAVSIPYHDMKRLSEIPKDTWAIAYCACPHHLSGIVVDELRKQGHLKALVLDEGINEWHRRGYPVTAAEGVTRPAQETLPRR